LACTEIQSIERIFRQRSDQHGNLLRKRRKKVQLEMHGRLWHQSPAWDPSVLGTWSLWPEVRNLPGNNQAGQGYEYLAKFKIHGDLPIPSPQTPQCPPELQPSPQLLLTPTRTTATLTEPQTSPQLQWLLPDLNPHNNYDNMLSMHERHFLGQSYWPNWTCWYTIIYFKTTISSPINHIIFLSYIIIMLNGNTILHESVLCLHV